MPYREEVAPQLMNSAICEGLRGNLVSIPEVLSEWGEGLRFERGF